MAEEAKYKLLSINDHIVQESIDTLYRKKMNLPFNLEEKIITNILSIEFCEEKEKEKIIRIYENGELVWERIKKP
jgi:hypothetical protein